MNWTSKTKTSTITTNKDNINIQFEISIRKKKSNIFFFRWTYTNMYTFQWDSFNFLQMEPCIVCLGSNIYFTIRILKETVKSCYYASRSWSFVDDVVKNVGSQLFIWWYSNGLQIIDWKCRSTEFNSRNVRIPFF